MASSGARPRPIRILVVHDDHELGHGIQKLLKLDGYSIDTARADEALIDRSRADKHDLILVVLEGSAIRVVNTAKRIRQQASLDQQTPIVIFSHSAVEQGAEEDIGENICITSPDDVYQLRALLARVLGRRSRTH
jgi:DNA-binding response OmpR family regulator